MVGLPTRLVFTVGSRAFSWRDVGAAARRWGTWGAAERRTREGIACRRHAEHEGDPLSDREVDRAAAAFRYDRGLLSADELTAWLARWTLAQPYWTEYIRRSLLRERWASELPVLLTRHPATEEEVDDFVSTELVCSGALERDAVRLAERVAVAAAVAGDPTAELDQLDRWFEQFRDRAASAQAIEREVHAQHVDWLRLECRWLAHTEEDVVREAALCIREDAREMEQVAQEAGAHTGVAQTYLEAAEPALRAQLLGARPGDVLGPLAVGGGFQLIEVLDKRAPTAEDPEIRERATQAIVRRAVEGEVVNRVRWHERLEG